MRNFINNLKNTFSNFFDYNTKSIYNFTIPENNNVVTTEIPEKNTLNRKIFNTTKENLNFIKVTFNTMINSDVVIREFILTAKSKCYSAFLVYIDGMVNQQLINDFVLNPLMLKNETNNFEYVEKKLISEVTSNNVRIRKVKKFNITDYIDSYLLPQNGIKKETNFTNIISGINSGNCALFIDTINIAFNIDVKGFKQRSVDTPNNEIVIKGPQEAFVENLRTNTSLLRRIINNENLIIEDIEIGTLTKTRCAVGYMKNITNNDLIAEVKFRLNNLSIDTLLSSGELEQLIRRK